MFSRFTMVATKRWSSSASSLFAISQQPQPAAAGKLDTYSRYSLSIVACLFAAGVVVQAFLVGLSSFDSPVPWEDPRTLGSLIGLLTWLFPILALVGRMAVGLARSRVRPGAQIIKTASKAVIRCALTDRLQAIGSVLRRG